MAKVASLGKISTADHMLEQIFEMQPSIAERASMTRNLRRVPDETIHDLRGIGFFLSLQPSRYGGLELSPAEFFKMQVAVAEACMSSAWACGIIAVHAFQIALMDDRAQQDVWGENIHTRVSSSYAPMGKVTPVEGGFRLSGRWGWSSGCDHCSWVLLGAIVPEQGYRTFLVPKSDYTIIDTWQSMGLQGTGSNDIEVDDVFVPDYRTHKQEDGFLIDNPGASVNSQPLYQIPWAQIFARTVCSPAIGACKKALKLFLDGASNKQSNDPTKLAGDTATQERIARAVNGIDEMEAVLYRNFDSMMASVSSGEDIPIKTRILYRYQSSLVIEKCIAIIDNLFESAGGASVFSGSEIQQCFLDIHTARAHVANNPTSFSRNLGATELGVDNSDFFI